ncbi:unnamed protein product [Blepharisma stoltei]|uniref:Uncharacterized protein n=1 Tax=Blepharisma stoltei TaxID=1481888 RepID=A0AAU9IRR7_9CILI|nr:unnamed protein product [Blepharisma stoltei]
MVDKYLVDNNRSALRSLFSHYTSPPAAQSLSYNDLVNLCTAIKIIPDLMSSYDLKRVVMKTMSANLNPDIKLQISYLNFEKILKGIALAAFKCNSEDESFYLLINHIEKPCKILYNIEFSYTSSNIARNHENSKSFVCLYQKQEIATSFVSPVFNNSAQMNDMKSPHSITLRRNPKSFTRESLKKIQRNLTSNFTNIKTEANSPRHAKSRSKIHLREMYLPQTPSYKSHRTMSNNRSSLEKNDPDYLTPPINVTIPSKSELIKIEKLKCLLNKFKREQKLSKSTRKNSMKQKTCNFVTKLQARRFKARFVIKLSFEVWKCKTLKIVK